MTIIAAFGLLMMCLSVFMIIKPDYWSDAIIKFSKMTYFHWFEVLSRFIFGCVFLYYHQSTQSPLLFNFLGYLLIAVSIGLLIVGENNHQRFALWSAHKFRKIFRPAGFLSFAFGLYIFYISINH
ncbi:hypothetical protein [Thalassotalea castellviae]|uniref:DUF3995 domain-containing protein n=1 Tax=Thalassotalea castellviae TaxID=3075612 RepID=A0ABU3A5S4_9GAMM|nr:hypothetical protein [Thalassotalea sp. W431]MDT0605265.1 hypothetical protein [Thalassotalea sp. W431]